VRKVGQDILDCWRCNGNALKAQDIFGLTPSPVSGRVESADTSQMQAAYSRRTYDHRIQEAICETGNRELFPELKIPRSTIRSWIHRGRPDVVTGDPADCDRSCLVAENHALRQRTALLGAVVGLLIAMLRVSKVRFDYERLP
jgi:hypothetical protein